MDSLCLRCHERPHATRRRVREACRSRQDRENNPLRYTYGNLKHHANERGIPFLLTPTDWQDFCERTGYIERRGQDADSLTVDRVQAGTRIRPESYRADNIAALTRADNAVKGNAEKMAVAGRLPGAPRLA